MIMKFVAKHTIQELVDIAKKHYATKLTKDMYDRFEIEIVEDQVGSSQTGSEFWLPDDSGKWVKVLRPGQPCELSNDLLIEVLTRCEQDKKTWMSFPRSPQYWDWDWSARDRDDIVAYKVV